MPASSAGAADVAEADVLDMPVANLRVAIEQRAEHLRAGLIEACGDELATAATAERGANAVNNDSVLKFQLGSF